MVPTRPCRSGRAMPNAALGAALALASRPTLAAVMRRQPLPEGLQDLLGACARREDALQALSDAPEVDRLALLASIDNYIQRIVLHPTGDSYRLLGGTAASSRSELRGHMKLLLEGLHPDKAGDSWRTSYAQRVIEAWREVSAGRAVELAIPKARRRRAVRQIPWIPEAVPARRRGQLSWRAVVVLAVAGVALVVLWRSVEASLMAPAGSFSP